MRRRRRRMHARRDLDVVLVEAGVAAAVELLEAVAAQLDVLGHHAPALAALGRARVQLAVEVAAAGDIDVPGALAGKRLADQIDRATDGVRARTGSPTVPS